MLKKGRIIFPSYFLYDCHKTTWISPDGRTIAQIDNMAISKTWRTSLLNVRNKRVADVGTDHYLLVGEIRIKIAKANSKFTSADRKLNVQKLSSTQVLKKYKEELNRQFINTTFTDDDSLDEKWKTKNAFLKAEESALGFKESQRKDWISDITWAKIEERKTAKNRVLTAKTHEEQKHRRNMYSSNNFYDK